MPAQFTTTRRVQFPETDMAGIVHFSNFYLYMEEAEHEYFRSLGLSIIQRLPDGSVISWPRVSASCTFEAPAYYEEILEIRLNVDRKGVKSLTMRFEFWRGDRRLARGHLKTVCCLFRPGQPMESIEIPSPYRERIEEHPAPPET